MNIKSDLIYKFKKVVLLVSVLFFTGTYTVQTKELSSKTSIRQVVEQKFPEKNVYIGATIGRTDWGSPLEDILNVEFGYVTPANDFKHSYINPSPGVWQWDAADEWLEKIKANNQLLRIHGPISPQVSRWARDDHRTKEELEATLEEFLLALIKRYNGKPNVEWIDVVNETITEEGEWFGPKPGNTKWENPWTLLGFETNISDKYPLLQQKGVPLYIIKSFEIATKYATDMKLMINQHRMTTPESIALIKELVMFLKERGLRVDAIGWQAHIKNEYKGFINANSHYFKQLDNIIKWTHANGMEFHVTEKNIHWQTETPYDENDENIAKVYVNILNVLLANRHSG